MEIFVSHKDAMTVVAKKLPDEGVTFHEFVTIGGQTF